MLAFEDQAVTVFDGCLERLHGETLQAQGLLAGWLGKGRGTVARLAAVLALLDWTANRPATAPPPTVITAQHLHAAWDLWERYYRPHAKAVFDRAGPSERDRKVRQVIGWIRAQDATEISREDVRRDALRQKVNAAGADEVIEALEEAGVLREVDDEEEYRGRGRPARRWQVNPALLAEPAAQIAEKITASPATGRPSLPAHVSEGREPRLLCTALSANCRKRKRRRREGEVDRLLPKRQSRLAQIDVATSVFPCLSDRPRTDSCAKMIRTRIAEMPRPPLRSRRMWRGGRKSWWQDPPLKAAGLGSYIADAQRRKIRSAALACPHEAQHMRGGRFREGIEVVAAFEHGDQPALGMAVGDRQQLLGQPDEILGLDLELRQRIGGMGVEARRHDDEFGRKAVEHGQDALAPGGAEFGAAGAGRPAAR